MPIQIKLSKEEQETALQSIIDLAKKKLSENFEGCVDLSLNIPLNQENLTDPDSKPVIIFSDLAYSKCQKLIQTCTGEVGWQGTVSRKDNVFVIEDIFVYPQTVTAATVTTDELEYAQWLMQLPTKTVNKLRFQAHSHVNMPVTPSATDTTLYKKFIKTLNEDDFYIFMIMNKRKDINVWLYDLKTNLRYNTDEIIVKRAYDVDKWYDEIKKANLIKEHSYKNYAQTAYEDYTHAETSDEFWDSWNKKYFDMGINKETPKRKQTKTTKGGRKK